jgi:hypothetical protein
MAFITNDTFRRVTAPKVATLPTVAQNAVGSVQLFTAVGNVHLISIVGVVTSALTGSAGAVLRFAFTHLGTGDAASVDLSAISAAFLISGLPVDSMVGLGDTKADPTIFLGAAGRSALDAASSARLLRPGVTSLGITNLNSDGSQGALTGGQITFHAIFEPHSPGAYMVPA